MAEFIEKQAAIDAIDNAISRVFVEEGVGESIISKIPPADVVPWSFLERYADWFCALVQYPEFIREAKRFYLDSIGAMEGGVIDG